MSKAEGFSNSSPNSSFVQSESSFSGRRRGLIRKFFRDSKDNNTSEETLTIDTRHQMAESIRSDENGEESLFISIGIDLGTTYSGVAWALSTSPNDIVIISSWETDDIPRSTDLHKVPSILTYDRDGEVSSWGYRLDEQQHQISWFKLCLSEEGLQSLQEDQPHKYERLKVLLDKYGKEPVDVVSDYLRCIWNHVVPDIKEKIDDWLWENIQLKIVLTVPAIWNHKAQELTRRAAQKAGLLDRESTALELIGEPEAAALEVFTEMRVQKRDNLKIGDTFIVCDAGGGTVDLISYKIQGLTPLQLSMSSESTGGLCGAIFVDSAFEKQMRTLISNVEFSKLSRYAKNAMMRNWEYGIKRSFRTGGRKEAWNVDIPGFQGVTPEFTPQGSIMGTLGAQNEVHREGSHLEPPHHRSLSELRSTSRFLSSDSLRVNPGTVVLKIGHLTAIFSEVCSKIIELINAQRAAIKSTDGGKEPAAILLVGGFGENEYLKLQLQLSFGSNGMKIQQPTKAWAAICRGAVLRGLGHNVVLNHVSKYHYGCGCNTDFVEGKHLEEDRRYDEVRCSDIATNQLSWFLYKGESVIKAAPVTKRFEISTLVSQGTKPRKHTLEIYYSDSLRPEDRIENGVQSLCSVTFSIDDIDYQNLPPWLNPEGQSCKVFSINLEMKISSGQIFWSVKRNGIDLGTAIVNVIYD